MLNMLESQDNEDVEFQNVVAPKPNKLVFYQQVFFQAKSVILLFDELNSKFDLKLFNV